MPRYHVTGIATYQFLLVLNPMMGNTENGQQFGPFETMEELKAFYDSQLVERYREEGPNTFDGGVKTYSKTFRKGGPLEWMNPLEDTEWTTPGLFGHGVHEILTKVDDIVKGELVPW